MGVAVACPGAKGVRPAVRGGVKDAGYNRRHKHTRCGTVAQPRGPARSRQARCGCSVERAQGGIDPAPRVLRRTYCSQCPGTKCQRGPTATHWSATQCHPLRSRTQWPSSQT
jgi:hypothetical protein